MTWSTKTKDALNEWLVAETAHSHHPHDDSRFYDFIFFVWLDEQNLWDEAFAKEKMKQKAQQLHPEWQSDMIDGFIEERKSEGTLILDFLSNVKGNGLIHKLK